MNYLEKNLTLLRIYDEELYQRMQDWLNYPNKESKFSVSTAKNGELTLQIHEDSGKVKFITSAYNPTQESSRWAENVPQNELLIVFGFGMGYHIEELIRREFEHITIIEPHFEIFALVMQSRDLEWLFSRKGIRLSIADTEKVIKYKYAALVKEFFNRFEVVSFSSYRILFPDLCTNTEKLVSDAVGRLILETNTLNFFGERWTRNFFENLYPTLMNPGVIGLFDKFQNIPTVIIAAGPSLNKQLPLIKELKGKALLLCVATAYKTLKNAGIRPDLIVSIDGSEKNYEIFKGMGLEDVDIPLVYDPTIYHQILKDYKGQLIPANVTTDFLDWFEAELDIKVGKLLRGPSVANITFDLARQLGGNPIIFVGQDLAYTDGRTHAAGTIYEKDRVVESGSSIMQVYLPGVNGKSVLSNRSFQTFLQWFEIIIAQTENRLILNATEGGAHIPGTTVMSLEQIMEEYCTNNVPISEIIDEFLIAEHILKKERLEKIIPSLRLLNEQILQFNKNAKKGINLVEELEQIMKKSTVDNLKLGKVMKALDKIDEKIKKDKDSAIFIQIIFQSAIVPMLNGPDAKERLGATEGENNSRIIRHSYNLYFQLQKFSGIVIDIISETENYFLQKLSEVS